MIFMSVVAILVGVDKPLKGLDLMYISNKLKSSGIYSSLEEDFWKDAKKINFWPGFGPLGP